MTHQDIERGSLDELRELIKEVRYAVLTTRDPHGALHSRPLTTLDWAFDGTAWFLVPGDSRMAAELEASPEVNLAYAAPDDRTFVSITGRAELQRDAARARELWNKWADAFFPGGPDDPAVRVLRVSAREAEYWTGPEGVVDKVTGVARALIGGDPSGLGRHARVELE